MDIEEKGPRPKQNRFLLGKRAKWADRVRSQFARGDRREWKTACPAVGACHGYRGKGTVSKTEPILTRQKSEVEAGTARQKGRRLPVSRQTPSLCSVRYKNR